MGHVPEHLLEAACVAVAKEHPRLSKKAVERLVRKLTKKPRAFDHILEEKRRVIREDSSVCCWAGNGVSVTMYGYYADSHHGICLQFRIEHRHQLGQVLPVNYVPDYPKLNYGDLARDPDLAKYLMFTKAQTWEHEEERRVFRYDEREGRVNFEPQQLVRIIFGVKCSDHDIGMVKNWINNWPCPVVLARAKAQEAAFALRIVDFETVGDD